METIIVPSVEEIFERVSKLPLDEIVGVCGDAFGCIIASHLQALHPEYVFSVQLGNKCIDYLPVALTNNRGIFYCDSEPAGGATRLPLPIDSPLWRMAHNFDYISEHRKEITAHEATLYLRGFIAATKVGWS